MRKRFIMTFILAAPLCLATSSRALEKVAARGDADGADEWNARFTCFTRYFNICTGWVWLLRFDNGTVENDQAQVGVHILNCCGAGESSDLVQSRIRYWTGSPAGYGFTGAIAAYVADANGCPLGTALESQPFLPPFVGANMNAFYVQNWNGHNSFPNHYSLAATFPGDSNGIGNPLRLGTDFGTTGPTGPNACGVCYPTARQSRSYLWQDSGGSYCPGLTLVEEDCEVELLWDFTSGCAVPVEPAHWGSIKALYR